MNHTVNKYIEAGNVYVSSKMWLLISILILAGCMNVAFPVNKKINPEKVFYPSEGVNMSALLYLPEGSGPHPAIVFVHGSGRSSKEGAQRWIDHLVEMGFAVLNHDKRGVGESGGVYVQRYNGSEENLTLLARDISAAIDFLQTRDDIDGDQIGLYGWSQAGWISPIVASLQRNLKFSILISGPTVTVGEENYYSELTGDGRISSGLTPEEMSRKLKEKGPYGFDPYPYLRKMNIPGLWVLGSSDKSIPIPETVAILDKLIKEDGRNFAYKVYEGANHGMRVNGHLVEGYWEIQDQFLLNQIGIKFPNK